MSRSQVNYITISSDIKDQLNTLINNEYFINIIGARFAMNQILNIDKKYNIDKIILDDFYKNLNSLINLKPNVKEDLILKINKLQIPTELINSKYRILSIVDNGINYNLINNEKIKNIYDLDQIYIVRIYDVLSNFEEETKIKSTLSFSHSKK